MRRLFPLFSLWLILLVAGCGSSSEDYVFNSGSNQAASGTTTVRLESVLAQTAVPAQVDSFRATGYDRDLNVRFGPRPQEKGAVVQWTGVPVDVSYFVIEYLTDGQLVGIAQVPVRLTSAQVTTISSPTIVLLSSALRSLTVTPSSHTIARETRAAFTATGLLANGELGCHLD